MGNGTQSQAGATPNGDTGATPNATVTGATPAAMTLEQALAALADREAALATTRTESIEHRRKLKAFEDAQAAIDAAKLSDIEKAAKRAETAETLAKQYQTQLQATQVKLAAQSLGFANPELAARLIAVEADATPEAITKALGDLLKSDPYLASSAAPAASSGGNPTNPQRGPSSGLPQFRTSEVANWTVEDFGKHQQAYAQALREGRVIEDR